MSLTTRSLALHLGLIALLFALGFLLPAYHQGNFARIMVLATYAIGYNVLFGYTGLLSLGHAMFFGEIRSYEHASYSWSFLQCNLLCLKVIYRRYASLFFIVGTKPDLGQPENNENELGMLEFIHALVETMDRWAGSICELDIMYQLEQVHFLLDEMVQNGYIVETNKANILRPLDLMEREAQKADSMYR